MDEKSKVYEISPQCDIPDFIMTEAQGHKLTEKTLTYLNNRVKKTGDGNVERFLDMGINYNRHPTNRKTEKDKYASDIISDISFYGDNGPTLDIDAGLEDEFYAFQKQMGEEVLNYFITEADRNIQQQRDGLRGGVGLIGLTMLPTLNMRKTLTSESRLPIKIKTSVSKSRLPVPIKECDKIAKINVFVEVKASRFPRKIRSLVKKFKKLSRAKPKTSKETEEKDESSNIDEIYKKALSREDGLKCRLPMPMRVTHPPKPEPPASRIPLAFSRFPNPAKVRKDTLVRRVLKAFTKQVAKINWNPKVNFPHLENFFSRILGSNRVMEIHI